MSNETEEIEVKLLLEAIYLKYQYDFRSYAGASMRRRLAGAKQALACTTLSALQEKVLHEPEAFTQLLDHMTVRVTELFRDPSYFRALREEIVPVLATYPSFKVWVAGCSTGEEVYSLAILLREEGLLERAIVYATDINPESLHRAEAGVFDIDRMAQFSRNYQLAGGRSSLSSYYTAKYGGALFDRSLRKHVVFSDHSLSTDSVFAEVQLISCRNVLIYFNAELQGRALALFQESLCRKGFLGLGSRESLHGTPQAEAFTRISPTEPIFQKV